MPIVKLTIQAVQNAVPQENGTTIYRDKDVTGFSLKVTPTKTKTFFFQYRLGGRKGKTRRITIGKFPTIKPEDARKIALQYAAEVARKIDPQERVKKEVSAKISSRENTFGKLFEIYKIKQLGQNLTGKDVGAIFERYFLPSLQSKAIAEISRSDISKIVNRILEGGKGYAANRALSNIKTFFRWTVSDGYLQGDPTSVMQKPFKGESSRERVLEDDEIRILWKSFDCLSCKPFSNALKLLLLLGQRRNEVGHMKWDDLNLDKGTWDLPREATKNKQPHRVPLIGQALEILQSQTKIVETDVKTEARVSCAYVFSTTGKTAISGWSKIKKELEENIASKKEKIKDWRIHDLRRTVSTKLGDLGYSDNEIAMLLNHSSRGVTAIYNRSDYFQKKEEMLRAWEQKLLSIVQGTVQTKTVESCGKA